MDDGSICAAVVGWIILVLGLVLFIYLTIRSGALIPLLPGLFIIGVTGALVNGVWYDGMLAGVGCVEPSGRGRPGAFLLNFDASVGLGS